MPLFAQWTTCYKNVYNIEYWSNNLLKMYIFSIGLFSIVFLPLIIIIDCFYPLLGMGPNYHGNKQKK